MSYSKKIGRVPSPFDYQGYGGTTAMDYPHTYNNPNVEVYGGGNSYIPVRPLPLDVNTPQTVNTGNTTRPTTPAPATTCNCLYGNPVIDINGNCGCDNSPQTVTPANTSKDIIYVNAPAPVTQSNIVNKIKENPLLAGAVILGIILVLKK